MDTAVKEHPMLFADHLAQAAHDGRKTQTRRPVTLRNSTVLGHSSKVLWDHLLWDRGARVDPGFGEGQYLHVSAWNHKDGPTPESDDGLCVYRVRPRLWKGDRIWVRETWSPDHSQFYPNFPKVYRADGYPAASDIEDGHIFSPEANDRFPFKWRPSIHMPRTACRTVLEITDVRAERIQDISEGDAKSEGVLAAFRINNIEDFLAPGFDPVGASTYRIGFSKQWNDLYSGEHSWEANPWVWVYEFKKV